MSSSSGVDRNELADLLAHAASDFGKQDVLSLDPEVQRERCRKLNSYGVLSLSALAAIYGISAYKVEKWIKGQPRPKSRGTLNPHHIPQLGYALSLGHINTLWLNQMLSGGTSISTIADLTGISEATLYRRKNER